MGKVAFVFPGQGAQKVGMGKDVADAFPEAMGVFRTADAILGEPLSTLCFEGPEDQLRLTVNTQPAIFTTSVALLRALDASCDVAAGHSLGEYSAHVAAATFSFEEGLSLLRVRARYMQEAVPVGQGAMAAVLAVERDLVERVCRETEGVVEPANYNSKGQIVIAGAADAVRAAGDALKEHKARVIPLPVSAPFHSSLMRPAEDRLRPHLEAATFRAPKVPVYTNVDAAPVSEAEPARDALVRQVSRPVRWEESVQRMIGDGVTLFVEIGPGNVLSGLIGRIDKSVAAVSVQSVPDLEKARLAIHTHRSSSPSPS